MGPYLTAFLFSKIGTYVSFIYAGVSAGPYRSTAKNTDEKKSGEDDERPHCEDMIGPPPVKVL